MDNDGSPGDPLLGGGGGTCIRFLRVFSIISNMFSTIFTTFLTEKISAKISKKIVKKSKPNKNCARSSHKTLQKRKHTSKRQSGRRLSALAPKMARALKRPPHLWSCCYEFWIGSLKEISGASGPVFVCWPGILDMFVPTFCSRHFVHQEVGKTVFKNFKHFEKAAKTLKQIAKTINES